MTATAKPKPSPFSPEETERLTAWLTHPDDRHVELLGGRLVSKFPLAQDGRPSMGKIQHGAAQGAIFAQVFPLQGLAPREGGSGPPSGPDRWWLSQEVDLYLGGEGVRPDVCGWRMDRHPALPKEENVGTHLGVITTPPDWVCEVLSTSTSARDRGTKWWAYQKAGIEWYWIVDLWGSALTVYQRTPRSYEAVQIVGPGDMVRLPPFESIEFALSPLFGPAEAAEGPQ